MVKIKSMIFKTITDEATGAAKGVGLFGKSTSELKNIFASIKTNGLFKTSLLSDADVACIEKYNNAIRDNVPHTEAMEIASKGASAGTQQLIANANGATISLKNMTIGAKASTIAMNTLKTVMNAVWWMLILQIVTTVISKIVDLTKTQENAIEKAGEAMQKIKEQQDSLVSNKKTLDEISDDYEKLSRGVDSLGRNVSLNTEEYARYNEIVNQIAEMFPQMVQGYTAEGNAIIAHKGSVEELTKAYEEQKKVAQDAIIVGSGEVFDGFKAKVDHSPITRFEESGLTQMRDVAQEFLRQLDSGELNFKKFNNANYNVLGDFAEYAGIGVKFHWTNEGFVEELKGQRSKIVSAIDMLTSELNAETAKIKPIMQAYLEQNDKFQLADDKVQDMVKQIVGQFDAEFYSQFDSEAEMATWVEQNVLDKLKGNKDLVKDFGVVFDLQTQFNKNEITLAEYEEKLTAFLGTIDVLPEETQKAIKLIFGISEDGYDPNQANKNKILDMLDANWEKAKEYVGSLKLDELEIGAGLNFGHDSVTIEEFTEALAKAVEMSDLAKNSVNSLSAALFEAKNAFELVNDVEKDFNSTGAISAENIQKILGKFPDLEDELYEYIMGMRTGASVMELLKDKSDDMGTMSAKAFKKMYLSSSAVSQDIKNDFVSGFESIGLSWDNTQSVMANVNTQIVDANGVATKTFVEQWTEACKLAGANVSTFAQGISALLGGDFYDGTSGVYRVKGKGIYYKDGSGMDGKGTNLVNVKAMELIESGQYTDSSKAYTAAYNILSSQMDKSWENQAEFERRQKEFEERMKQYAVTSDDKSGSEKNEALDNYLKDAENRYKIHQNEEQYVNDLTWAYHNLAQTLEEQLEIQGKIDEANRKSTDNQIKDIKHQIDLKKELHGEDVDVTEELNNIQTVASKGANDYRAYARKQLKYDEKTDEEKAAIDAWIENTDEIQGFQKEWWNAENQKLSWRFKNSQDWIEERNRLDDWHLFGDNEVKAWERVVKWLKEEYPHAVDEIKDAEEKLFDARKNGLSEASSEIQRYVDRVTDYYDKINEGLDKRIKKEEAILQITQKHTDVTGNFMDAQTELDKALRDSMLSTEYLTEDERAKIFNEDDYKHLSSVITSTQSDIDTLTANFMQQIEDAYANDQLYLVEAITAEYERQVDMKERELEIAKAQVDLAKKQLQLNNVLAEKNVKQLVERNGQFVWEWVADSEKVRQATEEYMDAEAKIKRAEYDKNQQLILNGQQSIIDGLNAQKGLNSYHVETLNDYVDDITLAIENSIDPIQSFSTISGLLDGASDDVLSAFNKITSSVLGTHYGAVSSSGIISTSKSSAGASNTNFSSNDPNYVNWVQRQPEYKSWAKQQMATNSLKWHTASDSEKKELEAENQRLGESIGSVYDEVTGTWKHKYATGSKYTLAGKALMGEDGEEIFITKNGRLIPINQPTIGNIGAGGIVFNREQMTNLRSIWDMSNIGKFANDLSGYKVSSSSQVTSKDTIFSGDINVYSPHDYNDFVKALTQRMQQKNI